MQEADLVHVLNSAEYLFANTQRRAQREALFALSASKLGQVLALQGHDQEVEIVGGAAADVLAHVVFALQAAQNGHFHLEHLFGLLDRLDFESHVLFGLQIEALVNLTKTTATDLAQLNDKRNQSAPYQPSCSKEDHHQQKHTYYSPTLFNDIIGHEQIDIRHFLVFFPFLFFARVPN